MKKITFACVAMVSLALAGCNGTATYDSYVETLEGQPAIIDTISSAPSYAGYLESLAAMAAEFDSKDVKLDETQKARLAELSMKIQETLTAKYNALAQTPMLLPSHFPVEEVNPADTTAVIEDCPKH